MEQHLFACLAELADSLHHTIDDSLKETVQELVNQSSDNDFNPFNK